MESLYQHSVNKIGSNGVDIKGENWKFIVRCSRPPHDLKFGQITSLSWRGLARNVHKCKTHVRCVQSFCFLLIKRIVVDHACLSSLLLGRERLVIKALITFSFNSFLSFEKLDDICREHGRNELHSNNL